MIPASHYRTEGERLAIGEQTRIDHTHCDAGHDTRGRLYVKRMPNLIIAFCHNCGQHGVVSVDRYKYKHINDLLKENEYYEKDGAVEIVLPPDATLHQFDWPKEAVMWLAKYGIVEGEQVDAGICYSPSWGRVILPVYRNGQLVYWQGRAVHGQKPKYLTAKSNKKPLFILHHHNGGCPDCAFVVEDYLSAIKINRVATSVALLGTSADINDLTDALSCYKNIGIILDPDLAGIQKAHELSARLSLTVRGRVRVFTPHEVADLQPKEMDDEKLSRLSIQLHRGL